MANPFLNTKNEIKPKEKFIVPDIDVEVEEQEEVAVEVKQPEPIAAPKRGKKKKNPVAGLITAKSEAKSFALYLDVDLVEELDRIAKENKTNRSKVVNVLLRQIVFEE